MFYGVIRGSVVATQKTSELEGIALKVLVPTDENGEALEGKKGEPIVVADDLGARPGDLVLWVAKREASMAVRNPTIVNGLPLDAAVTGIVDAIG